jgi:hypothetical protein
MYYGEERALAEIQSILDCQWKNGMLPQIRFVEGQSGYSPNEKEWRVTRQISGCFQDTSGITQPPILGYALLKIFKKSSNQSKVLSIIRRFYDSVNRYHKFLFDERRPESEKLVAVVHPWETGTDNSPYLDEPVERAREFLENHGYEDKIDRKDTLAVDKKFRPIPKHYECYGRLIGFFIANKYNQKKIVNESPFVIQDVMFNTILAASVKSISDLAKEFLKKLDLNSEERSKYESESKKNAEIYEEIRQAIQDELYDPQQGLFYSYDVKASKHLKVDTIHCLSPLFGECATPEQTEKLIRHLVQPDEFGTEVMIPTVSFKIHKDKCEHNGKLKIFEPLRYWRGPVWPVTNWIIYEGLKKYPSMKAEAEKLRSSTLRTIEQGRQIDREQAHKWAADLMEFNSYLDLHTTPSKAQYHHGWFWDSCVAAIGWVYVQEKPGQSKFWKEVKEKQKQSEPENYAKAYIEVSKDFNRILFYEYFAPFTCTDPESGESYKAGAAIGAQLMTWTAALYLDLLHDNLERSS